VGTKDATTNFYFLPSSVDSNLGIGNSSPTKKLTVTGAISASGTIFGNKFFDQSAAGGSGAYIVSASISGALWVSGSENIYRESNVAIGTTSAPKTLTVGGDISASGEIYSAGASSSFGTDTPAVGGITVAGDISASGNFYGSGLTNVGGVVSASSITTTGTIFANKFFDQSAAGGSGAYIVSASISGALWISGSENIYRETNVSIGTSNNSGKTLTVGGDISASGHLWVGNEGSTKNIYVGTGSGDVLLSGIQVRPSARSKFGFLMNDTDGGRAGGLYIDSDGDGVFYLYNRNDDGDVFGASNVFLSSNADSYWSGSGDQNYGIGSNDPTKKLTVSGDISASEDIYGKAIQLQDSTIPTIQFNPGGVAKARIGYVENGIRINNSSLSMAGVGQLVVTSSGNTTADALIGIGTETPNEMLTVGGNISASGEIYSAGASSSFGTDTPAVPGITVQGDISASGDLTAVTASIKIIEVGAISTTNWSGNLNLVGATNGYITSRVK
jgi:hypothetical protein